MENKSVQFEKVYKKNKNQFQKSAKINYIHLITSAKCLKQTKNIQLSRSNNNSCCRVCNNRKIHRHSFQGQFLRIQVFQNVSNQLNFDSMEK